METIHFCPNCECEEFRGNQKVVMDVIVDSNGDWIRNEKDGITDSDDPFGPFTCVNCGALYHELPIRVDESVIIDIIEKRPDFSKEKLRDVIEESVRKVFEAKTSNINNEGFRGQIAFLVKEIGLEDVISMIARLNDEE